jgi:hypothetical protein
VFFRVPSHNPTERARINAVNTRLQSGDGEIHFMIDPAAAPMTVKDKVFVCLREAVANLINELTRS